MRQLKISKGNYTPRFSSTLDKYLVEIEKEKMISPEEEVELSRRIKLGDEKALDKLVRANLRFVVSVAKQYQHKGLSLPDLVNEGNIGLIDAAKRFDETRGFKFISYAVWWIRHRIILALYSYSRGISLPSNREDLLTRVFREVNKFEQENERQPTDVELVEIFGIDETEDVKEYRAFMNMVNISKGTISIDKPVGENETELMSDFLPDLGSKQPDSDIINQSVKQDLDRVLSEVLNERERLVLGKIFGIDGNNFATDIDDVAVELGVCKERIRQIKEKALKKIRKSNGANLLKMYL